MTLNTALIAEIKQEAVNTRKMLERVPEDKITWKPHDKSMTIGRLASHIAELPVWINRSLESNTFDFASVPLLKNTYETNRKLLQVFDDGLAAALALLQQASDEQLNEQFTMLRGGQVAFSLPRKALIRNFAMNHLVHHRGQLSVFLRLLDLPVPGMYGPSADER